jgi:hypothetical protein
MDGPDSDSEMDEVIKPPLVELADGLNRAHDAVSPPPAPAPAARVTPAPAAPVTPAPTAPVTPAPAALVTPAPAPSSPSLAPLVPNVALEQSSEEPPAALGATPALGNIIREESPAPRPWRRAPLMPEPEPTTQSEAGQEQPTAAVNVVPDTTPATPPVPHPTAEPVRPIAPSSIDLPDSDLPQHMVDAKRYLTVNPVMTGDGSDASPRDWGSGWLACVQDFIEFQRGASFPDGGPSFPPATDVRPPEIAAWMKNRRPWKDVEIADVEEFGRKWWAWWNSLQPSSRISKNEDETLPPTVDMDWSKLQKPGKNGFLLVMLSLVWWGKASNRVEGWSKAVADVSAVLRCLPVQGALDKVSDTLNKRRVLGNSGAANTTRSVPSKRGHSGTAVNEKEGSSKRPKRG